MAERLVSSRAWTSPAELALQTERYGRHWWKADPAIDRRAAADPAVAALLASAPTIVTTADVYRDAAGAWHDRDRVHAERTAAQLGTGAPTGPPIAFFATGPVGGGKTSALRPLVDAFRALTRRGGADSLNRVAADEVREQLPEYAAGLGHAVVQDEAFAITYGPVYEAARTASLDLVCETIGRINRAGTIGYEQNLRQLKADGFVVHLLLVETPLPEALGRAEHRALTQDGRLVEEDFQAAVHGQPRLAFDRLRAVPGLLDEWVVVQGSGPPGQPPMTAGSVAWASRYAALLDALRAQAPS